MPLSMHVQLLSCVQLIVTLWTASHQVPCPWDSPGKNTGVDCHFLLQGIFRTQGSDLSPAAPALQADCFTAEVLGK